MAEHDVERMQEASFLKAQPIGFKQLGGTQQRDKKHNRGTRKEFKRGADYMLEPREEIRATRNTVSVSGSDSSSRG